MDSYIKIAESDINRSDSVKYLGVLLDKRLTFTQHVNLVCNKCIGLLIKLYPLINKDSKLTSSNKLRIYKTVVQPSMVYGCPVWNLMCKSNYNKLQVVRNKYLRLTGCYPIYTYVRKMHDELKIQYIDEFIKIRSSKFYLSNNVITNELLEDIQYTNIKYKHKRIKHNLM